MQERDGKFYWYLPMQKAATNSMSIGVAVGDSPLGPFRDALGKPLIDNTTANHSSFDIDPTVLVDDDGQAYIYWGSFSSPRVAKLKDNMVELADLRDDGGADGPRVAGQVGPRVKLNGSADHVSLPAGVVNGLTDFTISTWVNPVGAADVVADLRLRREHGAQHVPDRERRLGAALRDHDLRRRRRAAAERDRAAGAQPVVAHRGHAERDDRPAVRQRRAGGRPTRT